MDPLVALAIIVVMLCLTAFYAHRSRVQDQRENEAWWAGYRQRERNYLMRLATDNDFERKPGETDELYTDRFRRWIYDDSSV